MIVKKELILPIVFSVLFIAGVTAYASVFIWLGVPLIFKILIYLFVAALIIVMVYLLWQRNQEIQKEKEDDFSKY